MIDTRVITLSHDEICKAIRDYCNRNGKTVPHAVKVNIEMAEGGKGFGATVETPYIGDIECTNPECPLFPKAAREVLDLCAEAERKMRETGLVE